MFIRRGILKEGVKPLKNSVKSNILKNKGILPNLYTSNNKNISHDKQNQLST